jgi:hypothetical protein
MALRKPVGRITIYTLLVKSAAEPGRNDPCPCTSGRKYKKCHERVTLEHKGGAQQYSQLSVRDLVLREIRAFKEIFGVKLTETEVHIRENIADSDVQLFVERAKNMWNSQPDLLSHMPNKEDMKFRALYYGFPDMFSTVNLIARYTPIVTRLS